MLMMSSSQKPGWCDGRQSTGGEESRGDRAREGDEVREGGRRDGRVEGGGQRLVMGGEKK